MAVINFEPTWISVLNQIQRGVAEYELIRSEEPIEIASFGHGDDIQRTSVLGFDMQEILRVIKNSQMPTEANLSLNVTQPAKNFYFALHQAKEQVEEPPNYRTTQVSLAPEEAGEYLVNVDRLYISVGSSSTLAEAIELGWDGGFYIYKSGLGAEPGVGLAENLFIQIEGEWSVQEPTIIGPVGGEAQNVEEPITFKWIHNGALDQEKYELRYRLKGADDWVTVENESSDPFYTLPANSLSLGEYEWQVRTVSEYGFESIWSSLSTFTVAEMPATPVIIRPEEGEVIGISDLHIEIDLNGGRYDIELLDEEGNIVRQYTSIVMPADGIFTIENILDNNSSYTVRVRVNDGLYSAWAEVNFSVSYTPPADPDIVFIKDKKRGSITLYIDNPAPTGTEPVTTHQHLYRRKKGESDWIKLADSMNVNDHYIDYTPAANTDYEYRLRLFGENGTSANSSIFVTSIKFQDVLLGLTTNPAEMLRMKMDPAKSFETAFSATTRTFSGRRKPVVEFGEAIEQTGSISYTVDHDTLIKLHDFLHRQETLLYRDSRGRKQFIAVSNISVSDESRHLDLYSVSLSLTEVDYNEAIE